MRRMVIPLTMCLLLAAGCSLLPAAGAGDDPALHLLDARPAATSAAARPELVLAVGPPRAAPGFDTAAIAYVQRPHALDHYATHRWADTPARMFGQLLLRTLEDSGGFRAVVPAGAAVPADLRLDTEIVQLRQNFMVRPSRVELTLRVQLVDLAGRRVLATRYIEAVRDTPSDDAPGGVAAANAAATLALAQLATWCIDASARMPPRTAASTR